MNRITFIFFILTPNLLFGQSFLDKDLNLQGAVKTVNQIELIAIENNGKIEKGDTIECSELKYEFDNKNRLLKEEHCSMDILASYVYTYNNNGWLTERTNFGALDRKYEYDSVGNQVKELMFDSEGLMGYWTYKYDKNGNKIEKTGFLGDDFVERWKYEYGQENRKIKEYMVDKEPNNKPTSMAKTYEYDNDGRLISLVCTDPATKVNSVDKYKYNDRNEIIEHYSKNNFQRGLEEIITFLYTFDSKGNWIQRIEFENNKATTITERIIEYR